MCTKAAQRLKANAALLFFATSCEHIRFRFVAFACCICADYLIIRLHFVLYIFIPLLFFYLSLSVSSQSVGSSGLKSEWRKLLHRKCFCVSAFMWNTSRKRGKKKKRKKRKDFISRAQRKQSHEKCLKITLHREQPNHPKSIYFPPNSECRHFTIFRLSIEQKCFPSTSRLSLLLVSVTINFISSNLLVIHYYCTLHYPVHRLLQSLVESAWSLKLINIIDYLVSSASSQCKKFSHRRQYLLIWIFVSLTKFCAWAANWQHQVFWRCRIIARSWDSRNASFKYILMEIFDMCINFDFNRLIYRRFSEIIRPYTMAIISSLQA